MKNSIKDGRRDMAEVLIAPSILSADFAAMGEAVKNLKKWNADWVHCDVMDGEFVPNITFGMPMVEALRRNTDMFLDVHLMIVKPERYVERFVKAGADLVTFHPEASEDAFATIDKIKSSGAKAGIVLNPDIPCSVGKDFVDNVDVIMLMGVFPGFGGQKFIPEVMEKITELKEMTKGSKVLVELDGGVTLDNAPEMIRRGLDVMVAGNAVFKAPDPCMAIECLKKGRMA